MTMFPSIRELFGIPAPAAPPSPAQAAASSVANSQNATGGGSPGQIDSNATVPNATTPQSDGKGAVAFPSAGQGAASPLENYKDIWQTPANPNSSPSTLIPAMTVDAAKMLEGARSIDFTKGMDQDLLTKAASGDASALAQVINTAMQNGYAQGATASVAITKQALTEQANIFATKYAPDMLRRSDISSHVAETIPLSQDPAFAPVVTALTTQLTNKFPTASTAEISSHVENYLQDFSKRIVESKGGRISSAEDIATASGGPGGLRRGEQDWSKFFGVSSDSMQ